MKESGVTIKSKEIQQLIWGFFENTVRKTGQSRKKGKSIYTHNLLKLNQKNISNLNSSITNKSKTVIKLSPHEEKPCVRGTC